MKYNWHHISEKDPIVNVRVLVCYVDGVYRTYDVLHWDSNKWCNEEGVAKRPVFWSYITSPV